MTRPPAIPERLGHEPERQECHTETLGSRATIFKVDNTLSKLHRYGLAMQSSRNSVPDFSQEINALRALLDQSLSHLSQADSQRDDWQSYYDLLNRAAFIEELAYAPLLLNGADTHQELDRLIDGVYGLNVHLLADALEHYNRSKDVRERRLLRGSINEFTAIALLNRSQTSGHLTLPATRVADRKFKTDAVYYHQRGGTPYVTNLQVKSNHLWQPAEQITPKHGILITAQTMGNTRLKTSRAIVAELYAEPPPEHLDLDAVHATFIKNVHQEIEANQAFYPPHKAASLGFTIPS